MDDAGCVRLPDAVGQLHRDSERLPERQALAADEDVQRVALDTLHGDEAHAVGFCDVVDRDDIGVVQRRSGLGFPHEPPAALRVRHFVGGQDLEGHQAVQVFVARLVDGAHPPFAELLEDGVVGDRSAGHERGGTSP